MTIATNKSAELSSKEDGSGLELSAFPQAWDCSSWKNVEGWDRYLVLLFD